MYHMVTLKLTDEMFSRFGDPEKERNPLWLNIDRVDERISCPLGRFSYVDFFNFRAECYRQNITDFKFLEPVTDEGQRAYLTAVMRHQGETEEYITEQASIKLIEAKTQGLDVRISFRGNPDVVRCEIKEVPKSNGPYLSAVEISRYNAHANKLLNTLSGMEDYNLSHSVGVIAKTLSPGERLIVEELIARFDQIVN